MNETFVKLAEAFFVTKHSIHVAEVSLRQALLEPHNKGETVDTDEEQRVITCLKKVSITNRFSMCIKLLRTVSGKQSRSLIVAEVTQLHYDNFRMLDIYQAS